MTPISTDKPNNEVSVFKDPFNSTCIDQIWISYSKPIFQANHVWTGKVEFKNGLTSGEQKTPQCNTWEELMIQMKAIYDSLNIQPK